MKTQIRISNSAFILFYCLMIAQIPFCPAVAQRLNLRKAVDKEISVDGRSRSYLIFAPEKSKTPLPLLFVLHGGGGSARQMERYSRFNSLASQEKFLVCYPQGFGNNWNDGRGVSFLKAQQENIDDVSFLKQVVSTLEQEYKLDRSRIFCTGISNGAIMAHRMAAEASEIIAGIAPVVGGMAVPVAKAFKPQYPVSLFVIQGDSDPLVPIAGGEVGHQRGKKRGRLISTADVIAKYVKRNGIQGAPEVADVKDAEPNDGTTTISTVYSPGISGTQVQYYLIKQGGHAWPGRRAYAPEFLIGKACQDFDATEAIWKFFKSCPSRKK